MGLIKNLPFRYKLVLLVLPAMIGLIYFSGVIMAQLLSAKNSSTALEKLVLISSYNNGLVHELQKERGATAGYVNSNGKKFADVLSRQRLQTDKARSNWSNSLSADEKESIEPQVLNQLNQIDSELQRLDNIRIQVNNGQILGKDAIEYYTNLNKMLLSVTATVSRLAKDGSTANQLQAYYNFLQGKERAGIERAIMSGVFSKGEFNSQNYRRFVQLVTEQDAYFDTFSKIALDEQAQFFTQHMKHASVVDTKKMRTAAIEKSESGDFGIESTIWFKQSTGRINQLKLVEDRLTSDLLSLTTSQKENAAQDFAIDAVAVAALLATVLAIGIVLVRSLSQQLISLNLSMIEASENKKLSTRAEVLSEDELGQMAKGFNAMISVFEDIVREIGSKSTELASISEQTSSSVENNHQNLEHQRSETTMVATAIEEMTATVQEVATSTSATADAANDVDRVTEEGVVIVTTTISKMDNLVSEMNRANELIAKLHDSSNNIFTVVDVIKNVADQTNLLALNAAIEAARAGEQGRGFAVVADEVRSLAQRTQESTMEIETLINQFQEDSGQVSNSIENCSTAVDITAEQARIMEGKLGEIQIAVSSIKGMSQQIATAAEEQVAVTNEISQNIRSINDLSDETTEGGQQISQAANEQASLATGLHELSRMFRLSGQLH